MTHPALTAERAAVVTGAASGIGLAAAKRFAAMGMKVAMADIAADALAAAGDEVAALAAGGTDDVLAAPCDVADEKAMEVFAGEVFDQFGEVGLLMNNAVTRVGGGIWGDAAKWRQAMDVNFWGVVNGVRAFVPRMIDQDTPSIVVNSGSKQGITNPPGNFAYNVTKSALKTYTEALAHELRNTEGARVAAALLVPGWTTKRGREHQPGAWLPDQVIDFMLDALGRGDFYIICPDGEVTPEMDQQRILWAAGDMTEHRPALSRWHPDYADAFEKFSP
jgi:NAD(P)-dependent dehydrogenase (short-subunit alcohol dehydrogenase family)